MNKNILLVEPAYKSKFPPLGLMKISSYHKKLGDKVIFHKGIVKEASWESWDRIYITTLFTFYWKATVDTIDFYKNEVLRGDTSRLYVGGIAATLMQEQLMNDTGIINLIPGVMNRPKVLDKDNNYVIEKMIPDYSLLEYSEYADDLKNSYIGYATRGCPNDCPFCGVNTLEPKFIEYKGIKPLVEGIKKEFGPKHHLVLLDNNVLHSTKFNKIIKDILDLGFEKGAKLNNRQRRVDFNQGVEAKLLTRDEDKVKLISKIAIHPLRIAFDSIRLRKTYEKAVRLAAKYEIYNLSNYVLYNFKDTPSDLWNRLKININLNKELGTKIYSFPMKYMPLNGMDRKHIGANWNWFHLRNVQRILNVVKGSVMTGEDFFHRAFGKTLEEFHEILHMPEQIIMYRSRQPGNEEKAWLRKFRRLNGQQKELLDILNKHKNEKALKEYYPTTKDRKIKSILDSYIIKDTASLPLYQKAIK